MGFILKINRPRLFAKYLKINIENYSFSKFGKQHTSTVINESSFKWETMVHSIPTSKYRIPANISHMIRFLYNETFLLNWKEQKQNSFFDP
jgi:hypothetical protein